MKQTYMPPQDYLLANFNYNPDTGEFTNNTRKCKQKPSETYRYVRIWDTVYPAHRIIWLYMTGEYPDIIDHINGHKADNQWINLHNTTIVEHTIKHGKQVSKCDYPGIYQSKQGWEAFIKKDYQTIHIGTFDCLHEARQQQLTHPREVEPRIVEKPPAPIDTSYIDPNLLTEELDSIIKYNSEIDNYLKDTYTGDLYLE